MIFYLQDLPRNGKSLSLPILVIHALPLEEQQAARGVLAGDTATSTLSRRPPAPAPCYVQCPGSHTDRHQPLANSDALPAAPVLFTYLAGDGSGSCLTHPGFSSRFPSSHGRGALRSCSLSTCARRGSQQFLAQRLHTRAEDYVRAGRPLTVLQEEKREIIEVREVRKREKEIKKCSKDSLS